MKIITLIEDSNNEYVINTYIVHDDVVISSEMVAMAIKAKMKISIENNRQPLDTEAFTNVLKHYCDEDKR